MWRLTLNFDYLLADLRILVNRYKILQPINPSNSCEVLCCDVFTLHNLIVNQYLFEHHDPAYATLLICLLSWDGTFLLKKFRKIQNILINLIIKFDSKFQSQQTIIWMYSCLPFVTCVVFAKTLPIGIAMIRLYRSGVIELILLVWSFFLWSNLTFWIFFAC